MTISLAGIAPYIRQHTQPSPTRIDAWVDVQVLLPAAAVLRRVGSANDPNEWFDLACITGLDLGVAREAIEVLYHFCDRADVLTLRVLLPRDAPTVPTLTGLYPGVRLFEAELRELLGVTVSGLPEDGRLFLPDDWPPGEYPLREAVTSLGQGGE